MTSLFIRHYKLLPWNMKVVVPALNRKRSLVVSLSWPPWVFFCVVLYVKAHDIEKSFSYPNAIKTTISSLRGVIKRGMCALCFGSGALFFCSIGECAFGCVVPWKVHLNAKEPFCKPVLLAINIPRWRLFMRVVYRANLDRLRLKTAII